VPFFVVDDMSVFLHPMMFVSTILLPTGQETGRKGRGQ
jgi:hypothetical protein